MKTRSIKLYDAGGPLALLIFVGVPAVIFFVVIYLVSISAKSIMKALDEKKDEASDDGEEK